MMSGNIELVEQGLFCTVESYDYEEEYGIHKGSIVYLAGSNLSPISEADPYVCRILFIACPFDGEDLDQSMYYMDGTKLTPVSEEDQEKYEEVLKELEANRAREVH